MERSLDTPVKYFFSMDFRGPYTPPVNRKVYDRLDDLVEFTSTRLDQMKKSMSLRYLNECESPPPTTIFKSLVFSLAILPFSVTIVVLSNRF